MPLRLGHRFWIAATAVVAVFTACIVGRNALHAIGIQRRIGRLQRERAAYAEQIARDSALLERLRYDEYLEEFARERYRMHRPGEEVYIVPER